MEKTRAYHAPYTFAYPKRPLSLQVVLPDEEAAIMPVMLDFSVEREGECRVGRLRLLPSDGFPRGEHSVYSVTLTSRQLEGGVRLNYRFLIDGKESESYTVPLLDEPFSAVELDDPTPLAILPLSPQKRIYHGDGACEFKFEVAGESIEKATLFARTGESFVPYPATWSCEGCFIAVLPQEQVLSVRGKMEYYIEVGDGVFTVSLGSAERPLSVRVVDNKGPRVLATVPHEGAFVESDALTEIKVSYFDVSGIDAHASILCVDGANVSEQAIWKKGEVLYCLNKPLSGGKHSLEASLRDTLGNRTYWKTEFEINSETVSKKRRNGPFDGVRYMRELFSLVKDLFIPKE